MQPDATAYKIRIYSRTGKVETFTIIPTNDP